MALFSLLTASPIANTKVKYCYSIKICEMSKSPISIKCAHLLSFWQVVSLFVASASTYRSLCVQPVSSQFAEYLPPPAPSQGQKSANFNMTLKRNLFLFVYKSPAEEWQGVTAVNNVCGDYLKFATDHRKPKLHNSASSV